MAYLAPFLDAAGLHLPTYQDIFTQRLSQETAIRGASYYLAPSEADYQSLSVTCLMISDAMQGLQLCYNSRSPATGVGSALDGLWKLNGIARKRNTFSTCVLTITGAAGTDIPNGYVTDLQGNRWALPAPTQIPFGGSIQVSALCQTPGAITALPNQITTIATPTAGWTGVNNAVAAVPGTPVETDSQGRGRQAISVALPSRTLLAGTIARLAAVPGVTRLNVDENYTGAANANGNPAHSISAVVEGGLDLDVATSIAINRGIGPLTNGTTTVNVTDPVTGQIDAIGFSRPAYAVVTVGLSVHPLNGYTTATATLITTAVVNYLNSLQIGENLTISALYGAALAVMPSLSSPQFSIQALTVNGGTTDIPIAFNQVVQGRADHVTVTVV